MKRNTFLLVATVLLTTASVCLGQESANRAVQTKSTIEARTIAAVRAVLDAQRDAWNRGDVEGYMEGYARSADITFISGDSLTRGWQTVNDRYKKKYDTREKMGALTFSDLETFILSHDAVMMLGRWHLQRANDAPHGRFTLIFRRTSLGWRIIHDHTSSAE